MYMKFPEVMLVDATYKLLDFRIPVYLLLVIDGNGLREIIGLFLVEEESKEVISSIVNSFKEKNEAWSKTAVIMSDKDFTERESFSSCFPDAKLLICLYHALRSFRREVTCEKMSISSAECNPVLEIIQSIAYANSEEAYKVNLKLLQNTKLHTVVDYFMENWDSIKEQWVMFYKDQSFNLGETTNNRIESTFRHVKNVCTKYASLMQFFNEFFTVLKTFRNQRNHNYLMALHRKSTKLEGLDSTLQQYHEYATPYAFAYIKRQWELSRTLDNVTSAHITAIYGCECTLMKSMGLPYKHLFKKRLQEGKNLFDKQFVKDRWTLSYYRTLNSTRFSQVPAPAEDDLESRLVNVIEKENFKSILSQAQKFKKAVYLTQEIASLASEGGVKTFTERYAVLIDILKFRKLGKNMKVSCSGDDLAEGDSKNLTTESECQEKENEIKETDTNQKILEDGPSESNAIDQGIQKQNPVEEIESEMKKHEETELSKINMPPKMFKRGNPKGAELTVIGLPSSKKSKKNNIKPSITPFIKLKGIE